ncbi:MAG TPA: serine/threonine-protein kinase [Oligoflexia bacterium]|nr:serine/threonine-protein kinase [Oligoflexia bacterium]
MQEQVEVVRVRDALKPDYDVIDLIGSGGMGNVYLARSNLLGGAEVAIKVLHPEFFSEQNLRARFLREADLLRKVNHQGVVQFYDARTVGGLALYVMELVEGESLEQILKEGSFPLEKVPELLLGICEALQAVHLVGIIHRDLKPANILLTVDGLVKITDFGIARPERSQLTHHNEIVGSVCYIAPEIWIGEEPTISVDLYSLGVLLYELLTGEVPFDGSSPGDLMRKHLQSQVIAPKDKNENVPAYLNRLTLALLAKSRLERPKDALSVIELIKKGMGSLTKSHTFVAYEHDTQEFLRAVEWSPLDTPPVVSTTVPREPEILSKPKVPARKEDSEIKEVSDHDAEAKLSDQLREEEEGARIDTSSEMSWNMFFVILFTCFLLLSSGALILILG